MVRRCDQRLSDIARKHSAYLHDIARSISATHPDQHVTCDVEVGGPAECILIAEAERAVDLVVMAAHGLTGVRRGFRAGNVAGEVVRDGYTPVLLVPPHVSIGVGAGAVATA